MRSNWPIALEFVLNHEGGYWLDPKGGETNFGISKRWHPNVDIKNLTPEKAAEIYLNEYWTPAGCDNLQWPFDIMAFDTAVNQGAYRAEELLDNALNWHDYLMKRIKRYVDLKGQVMEGWINRVYDLYSLILQREIQSRKEIQDGVEEVVSQ